MEQIRVTMQIAVVATIVLAALAMAFFGVPEVVEMAAGTP